MESRFSRFVSSVDVSTTVHQQIYIAVFSKKTQVVRYLLESDACADVNAKDIREMTPWNLAALTNGVDAGYELVRQGANVGAQAKFYFALFSLLIYMCCP